MGSTQCGTARNLNKQKPSAIMIPFSIPLHNKDKLRSAIESGLKFAYAPINPSLIDYLIRTSSFVMLARTKDDTADRYGRYGKQRL